MLGKCLVTQNFHFVIYRIYKCIHAILELFCEKWFFHIHGAMSKFSPFHILNFIHDFNHLWGSYGFYLAMSFHFKTNHMELFLAVNPRSVNCYNWNSLSLWIFWKQFTMIGKLSFFSCWRAMIILAFFDLIQSLLWNWVIKAILNGHSITFIILFLHHPDHYFY